MNIWHFNFLYNHRVRNSIIGSTYPQMVFIKTDVNVHIMHLMIMLCLMNAFSYNFKY